MKELMVKMYYTYFVTDYLTFIHNLFGKCIGKLYKIIAYSYNRYRIFYVGFEGFHMCHSLFSGINPHYTNNPITKEGMEPRTPSIRKQRYR